VGARRGVGVGDPLREFLGEAAEAGPEVQCGAQALWRSLSCRRSRRSSSCSRSPARRWLCRCTGDAPGVPGVLGVPCVLSEPVEPGVRGCQPPSQAWGGREGRGCPLL